MIIIIIITRTRTGTGTRVRLKTVRKRVVRDCPQLFFQKLSVKFLSADSLRTKFLRTVFDKNFADSLRTKFLKTVFEKKFKENF